MAKWWKEGVLYQIYPKSFQDSNGDGIGDIPGIISRLDYLEYLGVDMLWLSPIFVSPDADNGYDISDYYQIRPEFGSLEDFQQLLTELHRREIRLILDMVVNHTSDEHSWFQKSRRDPAGPFGDFYHWQSGSPDRSPSNWGSFFGGSAWAWDGLREEYYLHLFHKKQPDLNWENPQLRQEIYKMMRHWLDKGVDGFRLDVINLLDKTDDYPDGQVRSGQQYGDGTPYFANGPRLDGYLAEMKREVFDNYEMVAIGETIATSPETAKRYVGSADRPLDMLIHFEHVQVDQGTSKWDQIGFDLSEFKKIITNWDAAIRPEGWNAFYLNNHDQPRAVSRFGDPQAHHYESATTLATLTLTLPATPFIYQGEEIGMTNYNFTDIDEIRDVESQNYYREAREQGLKSADILGKISEVGRDNSRTPMQWSDKPDAGFSQAEPWLRVNSNYLEINVTEQKQDPESILNYYKKIMELREQHPALISGTFEQVAPEDEEIFAYWRRDRDETFLILLNFSVEKQQFLADSYSEYLEYITGNYKERADHPADVLPPLEPYEARIYKQIR
ncbi:MAG: glycoside hydrolase family 13 protein [Bacillota bacterium]